MKIEGMIMINQISRHPSDIAQSAAKYLKSVKVSEKTRKLYEDVLSLFIDSLLSDPSVVSETADGEFVLSANWDDYYGGVMSSFQIGGFHGNLWATKPFRSGLLAS